MNLHSKSKIEKTFFRLILPGLLLFSTLFFSCEKENPADFVNLAEVAEIHLNAEINSVYLFSVFHKMIYDTALINRDTTIIDSAVVYRSADTISGFTSYVIDYGEGVIAEDFKMKSGKIEATLEGDFSAENATLQAHFEDFTIDGTLYSGTATYINTGQFVAGEQKLIFESNISVFDNQEKILDYQGSKEIFWTDGFATPERPLSQKFLLSGNASGVYTNSSNTSIPQANIESEISKPWEISFSCTKLIRQGAISIVETIENVDEIITGDMLDTDLDGCSDKIMLKNSNNFGYPVYL